MICFEKSRIMEIRQREQCDIDIYETNKSKECSRKKIKNREKFRNHDVIIH